MRKQITVLSLAILTAASMSAAEKVLYSEDFENAAVNSPLKQFYFNWGKPAGTSMTVSDKAAVSGKKSMMLKAKKGTNGNAAYAVTMPKGTPGTKKTLEFKVMLPKDQQYMTWELLTNTTQNVLYMRVEKGSVIATACRGKSRTELGKIIEYGQWYTFKIELPDDGKSPVSITVTNQETSDSVTKQLVPSETTLRDKTYLRFFCPPAKNETVQAYFDDFRYTE